MIKVQYGDLTGVQFDRLVRVFDADGNMIVNTTRDRMSTEEFEDYLRAVKEIREAGD